MHTNFIMWHLLQSTEERTATCRTNAYAMHEGNESLVELCTESCLSIRFMTVAEASEATCTH